jgi:hypothetical protein
MNRPLLFFVVPASSRTGSAMFLQECPRLSNETARCDDGG